MTSNENPDHGHLIALSLLPGVGPARLSALVNAWGAPSAWDRVRAGTVSRHPLVAASLQGKGAGLPKKWRVAAHHLDPAALAEAHRSLAVAVIGRDDPQYPEVLLEDPAPPEVLFTIGDPSLLQRRRVAIVGTRRCTRYGHDIARRLAHELSEAGVCVVSGLAVGVDGAAHRGALDAHTGSAGPIGVVGSGLDVIYPSRNRDLWHAVGQQGLLVSETPLGVRPDAWRFPARNRIIAALGEVLVVVESRRAGGSLLTVEEAAKRGRDVLAVPGPITAAASEGTNRLISDGAQPVLETRDVLDAMGIETPDLRPMTEPARHPDAVKCSNPDAERVLDELGAGPRTLEELASTSALSLERLALAVTELEMSGKLTKTGGYLEKIHL